MSRRPVSPLRGRGMRVLVFAALAMARSSSAVAAEPEAPLSAAASARVNDVSNKRLRFDVGFAHWFPDQFRHGNDVTSQSFGMGFRPGVRWIELRLRYDRSRVRSLENAPFFDAWDGRRAEFFTAGVALTRTLRLGNESISVSFGAGPLVVRIAGHPQAVGSSSGIGVEYLFGPPVFGTRLGAYLDARKQGYALEMPDGTHPMQVDFNVAVGFVAAFLD